MLIYYYCILLFSPSNGNQLREYMLGIGMDPENPSKCRICGEETEDVVLLEVHLAMKHLNLARNRYNSAGTTSLSVSSSNPTSEDSDSSASFA